MVEFFNTKYLLSIVNLFGAHLYFLMHLVPNYVPCLTSLSIFFDFCNFVCNSNPQWKTSIIITICLTSYKLKRSWSVFGLVIALLLYSPPDLKLCYVLQELKKLIKDNNGNLNNCLNKTDLIDSAKKALNLNKDQGELVYKYRKLKS